MVAGARTSWASLSLMGLPHKWQRARTSTDFAGNLGSHAGQTFTDFGDFAISLSLNECVFSCRNHPVFWPWRYAFFHPDRCRSTGLTMLASAKVRACKQRRKTIKELRTSTADCSAASRQRDATLFHTRTYLGGAVRP